jgi:hypothetical protein
MVILTAASRLRVASMHCIAAACHQAALQEATHGPSDPCLGAYISLLVGRFYRVGMRSQKLHDYHHGSDPGSNLGERLLQEAGEAERACTQIALPGGKNLAGG